MPQENIIPTDPVNDSVFHGGGFKEIGAGREVLLMQKHNLQLEADFEQESEKNTSRADT